MPVSDGLARRVVDAGRRCSLTTSVLEEWARRGTPKQVEYLAGCLEAERDSRDASRRAQLLRRCGLPAPKTFDGYDWSAVSWPDGLGREGLLSLSFLERREDLVLMGDVGTGKTHMASALCQLACDRRLEPRFFTASSLVMRLRRARDEGRLDREAAQIGRAALLVIDELGFLPLDADGGAARVPGLRRRLRAPVGGDHDEPGVLPLGTGLRGRPDGGCGHRPHRASRQARAVQRRVVPRTPRTHVGRAAQKWCAHSVRALLRFYCPFCSNRLDETQRTSPPRSGRTCGSTPPTCRAARPARRGRWRSSPRWHARARRAGASWA